jgi:hypothetical protein
MPRIGVGLGLGLYQSRGIFASYASRVVADGGVTEAGDCVDAVSSLLQSSSLLLIPSGYKGGKAYAEIPTNGNGDLTCTRASDAWRTNADGLIQRVPWNLLQYSEEFSNAYWQKNALTLTANTINAPNGTLTADQINENIVNTTHGIFPSSGTTIILGQSYTASMYVKKGNRSYCGLEAFYNSSNGAIAFFNLDNGTLLYQFAQGSGYSITNSSITNVGNDWYLLRGTFTVGATPAYFGVCMASTQWTTGTSYNNQYAGDISKFMYIWGAQLVEGSSAQTYFPTTDRLNVPRLSYMYGSCPALLLEPQRTNLALYSEQFDNAWWSKSATVTSNTTISPSGRQDADTFTDSSNSYEDVRSTSISITANATYTASVFIKKTTGTLTYYPGIGILLSGITNRLDFGILNTTTGQVVRDGSSNINVATYSTQSVGDYWRLILTFTDNLLNTICGIYFYPAISTNGTSISPTAQGSNVFWGAQLESGAYPTTYIPTTTASATRVADSFSRNNIYTNGLITSSGGTWFVELRNNVANVGDAGGDAIILGDTSSTLGNNFRLYNPPSSSRLQILKTISTATTSLFTTTTDTIKIAIKWNGSTADVFVNGTKQVSATAFTATALEFFYINNVAVQRFIQQMALYPSPLSDANCIALTT